MHRSRDKLREALVELIQASFNDVPPPVRPAVPVAVRGERVFSEGEEAVLTSAARGYLLALVAGGQIDRTQMDLIVHYVSLFWSAPVDVRDLESLLDQVVFGLAPEDPEEPGPWSVTSVH